MTDTHDKHHGALPLERLKTEAERLIPYITGNRDATQLADAARNLRDIIQRAHDLGTAAAPSATLPSAEPIAWMWQHPETGLKGFIEHCSEEDRQRWQRMNRPREIVGPLYDHAPLSAIAPTSWPSFDEAKGNYTFRELWELGQSLTLPPAPATVDRTSKQ